jgi:outer membrane protein assembly factor BamB
MENTMFNSDEIQKPQSQLGVVDGRLVSEVTEKIEEILLKGIAGHDTNVEMVRSTLKNYDVNLALRIGSEGEPTISVRLNAEFPFADVLARLFPPVQTSEAWGLITRASDCNTEGKVKWSAASGIRRAAANGQVCFTSRNRDYLVCADIRTGKEIWKHKLDSIILADPTFSEDMVFYGAFDNSIHALDLRTGHENWKLQLDYRVEALGAVDTGHLWFGGEDRNFHWINVENPVGVRTLDFEDWPTHGPSSSEGLTCVKWGDYLTVVDSMSGRQVWSPELREEVLFSPTIHMDKVYCHTLDGRLRALDLQTREELWNHQVFQEWSTTVVVGGGMVFSRFSQKQIRAFDAETGDVRWTFDTEEVGVSAPAYSDGSVFVIGCGHGVTGFCLNAETGAPTWRFALSGKEINEEEEEFLMELASNAPLCDGNTAFFNDDKGNLIAVGND